MKITRFKIEANYNHTGYKTYIVRVKRLDSSRSITIANACQLFRRTLVNPKKWFIKQENRIGGFPELDIDKMRLSTITILSITEEKPKAEKLFNIV